MKRKDIHCQKSRKMQLCSRACTSLSRKCRHSTSEDECAEEDIDWNKIPVGWHPANEEEAVARIEAIEAEYENGQYMMLKILKAELNEELASIKFNTFSRRN